MQPVLPIKLNKDWSVISPTVVPLVQRGEVLPSAGDKTARAGTGAARPRRMRNGQAPVFDGGFAEPEPSAPHR